MKFNFERKYMYMHALSKQHKKKPIPNNCLHLAEKVVYSTVLFIRYHEAYEE